MGKFHAQTIAKIFNGTKPRDIDQVFEEPTRIAINIETAKKIGYKIPDEALEMADMIYKKIE